jgi:hypothetical protein
MSVPRIDASGCGYWPTEFPTPVARLKGNTKENLDAHMDRLRAQGRQTGGTRTLENVVGSWPTPKGSPSGPDFARASRPGSGGDDLATAIARGASTPQTWGTPTTRDHKDTGSMENVPENALLGRQVLNRYATPRAEDSQCAGRRHNRETSDTLYAQTVTDTGAKPGSLNPAWTAWLMGWPIGWEDASLELQWECPLASTACEHLGTVRCLSLWLLRGRSYLRQQGFMRRDND